jgi:PAS domain S-box-containing protein
MRILFVAGAEADIDVVLGELRRHGHDPVFTVATSAQALRDALRAGAGPGDGYGWDLALIDDGSAALPVLEALSMIAVDPLRVPAVVMCRAVTASTAADLHAAGARDYVPFDDLARLVPVVEREAGGTQERRAQADFGRELEDALHRYKVLFDNAADAILMTDADGVVVEANEVATQLHGLEREKLIGREVFSLTRPDEHLDMVELGERMKRDGAALYEGSASGSNGGEPVPIEVKVRVVPHDGRQVVLSVARDISERRRGELLSAETEARLRRAIETTVAAMGSIIESRDPYTAGHERRVGELASAIAVQMGLTDATVFSVRLAAEVHDVGKISVPAEILNRPGRLSGIEFELIKRHSEAGFEILRGVDFEGPVAAIVLQHHERLDGSGYPWGLDGEEILPEARLMAVADVVEAMASHRPYRPALGLDAALGEIARGRGTLYDPDVADACRAVFSDQGFAFTAPL